MWKPTCPEPEPEPASPSAALSLPSPPTPPPTHKNGRDPYSTQQNWRTLYLAQLHRQENGKKWTLSIYHAAKLTKFIFYAASPPHNVQNGCDPFAAKWTKSSYYAAKWTKIDPYITRPPRPKFRLAPPSSSHRLLGVLD